MPGVSGIKGCIPAPALSGWFKSFTASWSVDNREVVAALAETDRTAAIELVAKATDRHSRKAAERGTRIHALCEQLMRDRMAGVKSTFHVARDELPYLRSYASFVSEFKVVPHMIETTVWNREHEYAGTFDLLCELDGYPGLSIVDTKSGGSGVYPDAGLQQVAYKYATHYIDEDGEFQPMPPVERTWGLWLQERGYALYPLRSDDYMFEVFLKLRDIFTYVTSEADSVVGKPVNANPIKRIWKPR